MTEPTTATADHLDHDYTLLPPKAEWDDVEYGVRYWAKVVDVMDDGLKVDLTGTVDTGGPTTDRGGGRAESEAFSSPGRHDPLVGFVHKAGLPGAMDPGRFQVGDTVGVVAFDLDAKRKPKFNLVATIDTLRNMTVERDPPEECPWPVEDEGAPEVVETITAGEPEAAEPPAESGAAGGSSGHDPGGEPAETTDAADAGTRAVADGADVEADDEADDEPDQVWVCDTCGAEFDTHHGHNSHQKSHRDEPDPEPPEPMDTTDALDAMGEDVAALDARLTELEARYSETASLVEELSRHQSRAVAPSGQAGMVVDLARNLAVDHTITGFEYDESDGTATLTITAEAEEEETDD